MKLILLNGYDIKVMYIWRWSESYSAALFDPMNYSPPSSYIHGISQAKIEYWSGLLFPSPHSFIFNFCFISEYSWFDNAVLVSGVQQSGSVIHLHIYILFQILFSLRSLQRIELSSLLYSTGNSAHILLKLFSSEWSVVMDPSWRT